MVLNLLISVEGKPQQQGSKTAYVISGRAVLTEANKHLAPWRKTAIARIQEGMGLQRWVTSNQAIKLTVLFVFEKPKTVTRTAMSVKPDTDHLIRAVGDALTQAGAIKDDSQIVEIHAKKMYGKTPRTLLLLTL